MPVERRWYEFKREDVLSLDKGLIGIYSLADKDKIPVYIGSSERSNIRGRLMTHLRIKRCPKARYFKYILARMLDNPKQMETQAILRHVRKYRKLPLYIKSYPLLKVYL